MKFSELGRIALASAASVALALGITACGQSNTIDYVFVTSSKNNPGNVFVFRADGQSGALTRLNNIFSSGGRNPVAEVVSPNNKYLYVVNHDDATVVQFAIGSDGKIYPQTTKNTPGSNPNAVGINSAGTFLFVTVAFQPGFTSLNPGPGGVVVYPINANGTLGDPVPNTNVPAGQPALSYFPACNNPVAINVLGNGTAVYVVNNPGGQPPALGDTVNSSNASGSASVVYPPVGSCSGGAAPQGQITTYNVGTDGSLTPGVGSPYSVGAGPSAIASDPTLRFVYVTDSLQNQLFFLTVQPNGGLQRSPTPPSNTDQFPDAVTVDPRGQYIFVANYNAGNVSAFAINQTTGVPSQVAGAGTYAVSPGPAAILVDPAIGRYVYTANFIDNSVSGLFLDPNAGTLTQVQNTPFTGIPQATAVAAIRHNNHAIQKLPQY
jgi:6-phosphogluconolactonase (cycloisomerase 2 family)